jgi:hypothetical protein
MNSDPPSYQPEKIKEKWVNGLNVRIQL